MTPGQLKKLEREWAARLRASGFQDIESPSGMLQSWDRRSDGNLQDLSALAEDKRQGESLRFDSDFERRVWQLHTEGKSNRAIATQLCVYRKLVNQTMWRLTARAERRRPGPRRNPEAIRHDGCNLTIRLSRDAAAAREELDAALTGVTLADLLRQHILDLARKIPRRRAA
ncbi:MAG: hypothetical protein LC640_08930 [Frankia sp.]|nr:hypothetical protein [Frankia sp.]